MAGKPDTLYSREAVEEEKPIREALNEMEPPKEIDKD